MDIHFQVGLHQLLHHMHPTHTHFPLLSTMEIIDFVIAFLCLVGSLAVMGQFKHILAFFTHYMPSQHCAHCSKGTDPSTALSSSKSQSSNAPCCPSSSTSDKLYVWVTVPKASTLDTDCYHLNEECPRNHGAIRAKRLEICSDCKRTAK